jgi:integrase
MVKTRLDPVALRTAEARRAWAIAKSRELAKRRLELEDGAPRKTGKPLSDAIEDYFNAHKRLRPKTVLGYRAAANALLAWASDNGVTTTDDLNRARLVSFRDYLIAMPKHAAAKRGRRGERRKTADPRSELAVNRDLRSARTILGYLFDLDLLPKCSEGDLRRGLRHLDVPKDRVVFLRRAEIAGLLAACKAHDAECFSLTRDGATGAPRYDPIAPLTLGLLLSGMRLGEATSLTWEQVDLAAGEIYLTSATKTHQARTIDLSVSPLLARDLAALRPAKPAPGALVWGVSYDAARAAAKRLRAEHGAPPAFTWQVLRSTTATYLTNAPGIFGAASAYRSARQLGHSVTVAERSYLGVVKVPPGATTLEAAMGIDGAPGDG